MGLSACRSLFTAACREREHRLLGLSNGRPALVRSPLSGTNAHFEGHGDLLPALSGERR